MNENVAREAVFGWGHYPDEDPREWYDYDERHLREQDWLDWLRCDREEDELTRTVGEFSAWVTQTFWNPVMYEGDPCA